MPWLKKPPRRARTRSSNEHKKIAGRLYNKSAWRRLRDDTLSRLPYCVVCLCRINEPMLRRAEQVHHLVPILSGMDDEQRAALAYAPDNVAPLCCRCHRQIHEQGLRGVDVERFYRILDALHSGVSVQTIGSLIAEINVKTNV